MKLCILTLSLFFLLCTNNANAGIYWGANFGGNVTLQDNFTLTGVQGPTAHKPIARNTAQGSDIMTGLVLGTDIGTTKGILRTRAEIEATYRANRKMVYPNVFTRNGVMLNNNNESENISFTTITGNLLFDVYIHKQIFLFGLLGMGIGIVQDSNYFVFQAGGGISDNFYTQKSSFHAIDFGIGFRYYIN